MSSEAAVGRARLLSGTVGAVAACAAALLPAPVAAAAPYPPTQPCVVTAALAAHRANTPRPGVVDIDVRGAGLTAGDAVSLTTGDGRTLARVRADTQGGFTTVLTAPAGPGGATPALAAVTARERCVTNPPGSSPGGTAGDSPGGTNETGPGDGTGDATGDGPGGSGQGSGTNGANGSDGAETPGGGNPAATASDPLSTDMAGQPTVSANPASPGASVPSTAISGGGTSTSVPPRADVPRGTGPSLGIGLAIAAALLVLGTLAVLLLTRRPEH